MIAFQNVPPRLLYGQSGPQNLSRAHLLSLHPPLSPRHNLQSRNSPLRVDSMNCWCRKCLGIYLPAKPWGCHCNDKLFIGFILVPGQTCWLTLNLDGVFWLLTHMEAVTTWSPCDQLIYILHLCCYAHLASLCRSWSVLTWRCCQKYYPNVFVIISSLSFCKLHCWSLLHMWLVDLVWQPWRLSKIKFQSRNCDSCFPTSND